MGGSVERLLEVLVSSSVTDTMKNGYHVIRPSFHVQLQRPDLSGITLDFSRGIFIFILLLEFRPP